MAAPLLDAITVPLGWIDAFVLVSMLRHPDPPHDRNFALALQRLRAVGPSMLAAMGAGKIFESVIQTDDTAVAREIVRVLHECVIGIEGLLTFAEFLKCLLRACPRASVGLVEEMMEAGGGVLLVNLLDVLGRAGMRVAADCRDTMVRVNVVKKEGGWGKLLVALRKGLLGGKKEEVRKALELGREIMRMGEPDVLEEAMEVLNTGIVSDLNEMAGVGGLGVLGVGAMWGALTGARAKKTWEERCLSQCPDGLMRERSSENGSRNPYAVQVDVGLCWNQDPNSVSIVVPSSVVLQLASNDGDPNTERIAAALLDVSVLVPIVCIPLYEAVGDFSRDFDLVTRQSARKAAIGERVQRIGRASIPDAVMNSSLRDLSVAVSSFGSGMATIVGLVNTSCLSSKLYHQILFKRGRGRNASEKDKNVLWTLLERLTEFDRMLNAMLLGCETLQNKKSNPSKQDTYGDKEEQVHTREIMKAAESTCEAVMRTVFSLNYDEELNALRSSEKALEFPRFSLQCLVCSLIAVPDEVGIEELSGPKRWKQTRDVELARVDKMLLRHLHKAMNTFKLEKQAQVPLTRKRKRLRNVRKHDRVKKRAWDLHKMEMKLNEMRNNSITPDMNFSLNLFLTPEDEVDLIDNVDPEADDLWAVCGDMWGPQYIDYVQSVMATFESKNSNNSGGVAQIIHSPAFAAFLLDRAATYVAVGRRARQSSSGEHYLSTTCNVSGFALGCLNNILRVVSICSWKDLVEKKPLVSAKAVANDNMREFLRELDKHLLATFRHSLPDEWEGCTIIEGARAIQSLLWICESTIDATVATLSVEAIFTLSELNCLRADFARDVALRSLSTVYEYDGNKLWSSEDQDSLFDDNFCHWSYRRRQTVHRDTHDQYRGCNRSPQIDNIGNLSGHMRNLGKYRVCLYFSGMHIPCAILEACGWVRELSLLMSPTHGDKSNGSQRNSKVSFHVERPDAREKDPAGGRSSNPTRMEAILDMVDVHDIIDTLLQLVLNCLEHYQIPEGLTVDALEHSNPMKHIEEALKLFCGILQAYHRDRQALHKAPSGETGLRSNSKLDNCILSLSIILLQRMRVRIDNMATWYSAPGTDLSMITEDDIDVMERILGCSMTAANRCIEICEMVKIQYAALINLTRQQEKTNKAQRKVPGFIRTQKKGANGMEEELSKASRALPRLTVQAESVKKGVLLLAKMMGFRLTKSLVTLTPTLPNEDENLGLGVGLQLSADEEDADNGAEEGEDTGGEDEETCEDTPDDGGFHARQKAVEMSAQPETITVRFR